MLPLLRLDFHLKCARVFDCCVRAVATFKRLLIEWHIQRETHIETTSPVALVLVDLEARWLQGSLLLVVVGVCDD